MTLAKEIAQALTEMSTTGEDFLAGESNGEIVIERYFDNEVKELLTLPAAITYARVFAIDGATKCTNALSFLVENGASQLVCVKPQLKKSLEVIKEAS